MKTLGLIGGMSWESSQVYYQQLNRGIQRRLGGLSSAQCLMDSVNFQEIAELQVLEDWDALTHRMVDSAQRLKAGGAEGILICTNTMHRVAPEVEDAVGLPLIHIGKVTGNALKQAGISRACLLGTKYTMEGTFYREIIEKDFTISVEIPNPTDRQFIHDAIFNELCCGKFLDDTKKRFLEIIQQFETQGVQAVVLGCTEIPLLIHQKDCTLPVYDTLKLHADAAVEWMLA